MFIVDSCIQSFAMVLTAVTAATARIQLAPSVNVAHFSFLSNLFPFISSFPIYQIVSWYLPVGCIVFVLSDSSPTTNTLDRLNTRWVIGERPLTTGERPRGTIPRGTSLQSLAQPAVRKGE